MHCDNNTLSGKALRARGLGKTGGCSVARSWKHVLGNIEVLPQLGFGRLSGFNPYVYIHELGGCSYGYCK
jgi:hypothetical protein